MEVSFTFFCSFVYLLKRCLIRIEHWLKEIAKLYQIQPDADQVLLPFTSRGGVYDIYLSDNGLSEQDVSKSYFVRIWREQIGAKISLRKHLRFAKCDECVKNREEKAGTVDRAVLERIKAREYEHYKFVRNERGGYYIRRETARTEPGKYLSIIIDGADAKDYGVPYFCEATHSSQKLWQIPVYIIGVLVHGRQSHVYCVPGHFKQGANVIIDVLYRTLKAIVAKGEKLPETLYLQLDNTVKQNKNRFLLGFLGMLVQAGVFKHIILSFLPVGHTHEDIDQLFSRIVIALLCRNARSYEELAGVLRGCYRDKELRRLQIHWVASVRNFSDYISDYMPGRGQRGYLEGLMRFRQFSIRMHVDGFPMVRCRFSTLARDNFRGVADDTDFTPLFPTTRPAR